MKKTKLLQGKTLTNKLDQVVRDIFKLLYGENPTCFVCDRPGHWFKPSEYHGGVQVGHYITRKRTITRWFFPNLFPQCAPCNRIHNTNPAPFSSAIIRKVGAERIMELNQLAKDAVGKKVSNQSKREHLIKLLSLKEDLQNGRTLTDGMLSVNLNAWMK